MSGDGPDRHGQMGQTAERAEGPETAGQWLEQPERPEGWTRPESDLRAVVVAERRQNRDLWTAQRRRWRRPDSSWSGRIGRRPGKPWPNRWSNSGNDAEQRRNNDKARLEQLWSYKHPTEAAGHEAMVAETKTEKVRGSWTETDKDGDGAGARDCRRTVERDRWTRPNEERASDSEREKQPPSRNGS